MAPSAVCPTLDISNLDRPSVSSNILKTGIPLSPNLFNSSNPKPPAVVLANKSVIACKVPILSADTAATSWKVVKSFLVGSIPAPLNLMKVFVKSLTSNIEVLAKSSMKSNASLPCLIDPVTDANAILKSWNCAAVFRIAFAILAAPIATRAVPASRANLPVPIKLLFNCTTWFFVLFRAPDVLSTTTSSIFTCSAILHHLVLIIKFYFKIC